MDTSRPFPRTNWTRRGPSRQAFAGQRPTVAFSHAWHRELVAQDVARRRRGAGWGTGEGGGCVGGEAAARREADGEEAAAGARRGALSMMRLKMTNNSSQVVRMHEAAGIAVQRAQGARGKASGHFNAWWAHPLGPSDKRWRLMLEHQRINHFPGTFLLGRKDRLTRCLGRFRRRAGRDQMDFYPRSFILPGAYADFKAAFAASKGLWIWKPQASARGIGIRPPPYCCPYPCPYCTLTPFLPSRHQARDAPRPSVQVAPGHRAGLPRQPAPHRRLQVRPPPAPGPPESRGPAPALRMTARRIIREARRRFDIRLYAVATSFNPVCPRAPCRGDPPQPPAGLKNVRRGLKNVKRGGRAAQAVHLLQRPRALFHPALQQGAGPSPPRAPCSPLPPAAKRVSPRRR